MKKGLLIGAALGAGAYWASRQPGGVTGTWGRLQQGVRDVMSGQDALAVGKRFLAGQDQERADVYMGSDDSKRTEGLLQPQPYQDMVSSGV